MIKQTLIPALVSLSLSAVSVQALADKLNAKNVEKKFWNVVEAIQNEDPSYFQFFKDSAVIDYNMPASYQMPSGKISLQDFKLAVEGFWQYTENHSFDLDQPKIQVKGDTAEVSATFYERYTIQGYTLSNKSEQNYTFKKVNGKLIIAEFSNTISDITDSEYQQKTQAIKAKNNK